MLPTVRLQPFHYRGGEIIGFDLLLDNALEKEIRKLKGIKWCGEKRMWYIPLNKESYEAAKDYFKDKFSFDAVLLRRYLEQRKATAPLLQNDRVGKKRAVLFLQFPLSTENLAAFQKFQQLLTLKGYSPNTVRTYTNEFHLLLRLLNTVNVATLEKKHVCSYLLWLIQKRGYSEQHVHTTVNALKFYFEQVEGRAKEFYDLPRPKKAAKTAFCTGRGGSHRPNQKNPKPKTQGPANDRLQRRPKGE